MQSQSEVGPTIVRLADEVQSMRWRLGRIADTVRGLDTQCDAFVGMLNEFSALAASNQVAFEYLTEVGSSNERIAAYFSELEARISS